MIEDINDGLLDLENTIIYEITLIYDREELDRIIMAARGQIDLLNEMDGIKEPEEWDWDKDREDMDEWMLEYDPTWMNDPDAIRVR